MLTVQEITCKTILNKSGLAGLNLEEILVDRLNLRWGVLNSLKKGLSRGGIT